MATEETIEGGTLRTLTAAEVKAAFDDNEIVLIDVRTPQEYAFQHIKGALLFPLASFEAKRLPEGRPIVFHCGSGMRSRKVATMCLQAGMKTIAHMEGGFGAWKNEGLPYCAVDPATGSIKDA